MKISKLVNYIVSIKPHTFKKTDLIFILIITIVIIIGFHTMINNFNTDFYTHYAMLFILALSVRVLPILLFSPVRDSDYCCHLYLIKSIRKNNNNIPKHYPRIPEKHRLSYPPFLHFLLSYVSPRRLIYILNFFNPTLDAIVTSCVFISLFVMTNDIVSSWMGALIYLFTPLLFSHQALGPRITNFTARVFGECLFFFVLLCLLFDHNIYFLLLGGFIAGLIFISSQFSSQVVLLTIPLSILFGSSYNTLLVPIIGLIVASIIGRNRFFNGVKDKIGHYKKYILTIFSSGSIVANRRLLRVRGVLGALKRKSLKSLYEEVFILNTLLIILFKAPIVIYLVYQLNFPDFLEPYIIASITVFILTSLKPLLFLGEAERYIVHYFPIFAIATALTLSVEVTSYFVIYGFIFYIFDVFMLDYKKKHVSSYQKSDTVINYLKEIKNKKMVATNPLNLGGFRVLSDTIHSALSAFNFIYAGNSFHSSYEFLDENKLNASTKHYDIELFFFDEYKINSLKTVRKELNNFAEIKLDHGIILFRKDKENLHQYDPTNCAEN